MVKNYINDFDDWYTVQSDFDMDEMEPDDVYLADYTYEDYEGYSTVIYRRGESFFVVTGSHCSCYGLEGQWEPEVFENFELFKAYCLRVGGQYAEILKTYFNDN